ncbi:MAG TPA: hypothetical protein VIK33_13355, partial [Anaerolineae bacterium]
MMMFQRAKRLMAVAILVSACAPAISNSIESPVLTPTLSPSQRVEQATSTPIATKEASVAPTVAVPASLQPLIDTAIADLSERLSIDATQITVVGFSAEVWPDASLGCPEPGVQYAQVLTEGYR